jgi:IS30 family transposase
MADGINIGKIISDFLKSEGRTSKWLAQQINLGESTLCRTLKRNTIRTDILYNISNALNHDFFRYFSDAIALKRSNSP